MALTLQNIMDEADLRVPNAFTQQNKTDWLNEINNEFFDIVKIPAMATISGDGTTTSFTISSTVKEKNVRKVVVGSNYYRSMLYEDITAAYNFYWINEAGAQINFSKAPPSGSQNVVLVYDLMPATTFVSTTLTVNPDAPAEYHWLYVLALASRIAKAQNDVALANNYETDFKNNLAVAQQNYVRAQG